VTVQGDRNRPACEDGRQGRRLNAVESRSIHIDPRRHPGPVVRRGKHAPAKAGDRGPEVPLGARIEKPGFRLSPGMTVLVATPDGGLFQRHWDAGPTMTSAGPFPPYRGMPVTTCLVNGYSRSYTNDLDELACSLAGVWK